MKSFSTQSDTIRQIIKGLNLTKTLFVSSIIIGEPHTGKKTLIRHLFPQTPMVSGKEWQTVASMLQECDELIITDFEQLGSSATLDFGNKRIIATANISATTQTIDSLFAFIYHLPALRERPEDIPLLQQVFCKEALHDLMLPEENTDLQTLPEDLSSNNRSLKRAIYRHLLSQTMDQTMIQETLYHYFSTHLEGKNGYRDHLHLYEVPLIQAGLKKFGSQLKLSQVLGINRNTLRKKIYEHNLD